MVGVMGRAIDDALQDFGDAVVTVVYGNGPDVDKDVETQVGDLV